MSNINLKTKTISSKLITFSIITLLSFLTPAIIHKQAITGPIINACLILATSLVGPTEAIVLGLAPSIIALSRGLLPLPLAPLVPFIMASNTIYIITYYYLAKKSKLLAILTSSTAKFLFLSTVTKSIMSNLLKAGIFQKAVNMMTIAQLTTALIGGLIALTILSSIKQK